MQPQLPVSGALGLRAPHPPFLGQHFSIQCGILPSPGTSRQEKRNKCSTLSLPRVPMSPVGEEPGRALRAGISLEMPRTGQDSTWSQLGCRWSWPGRDQRSQGPFSSPFLLILLPPQLSLAQAGLAGLDTPDAWFSCKDWRQTAMVCQRPQCLPSAVPGCSQCPCVPGWLQRD